MYLKKCPLLQTELPLNKEQHFIDREYRIFRGFSCCIILWYNNFTILLVRFKQLLSDRSIKKIVTQKLKLHFSTVLDGIQNKNKNELYGNIKSRLKTTYVHFCFLHYSLLCAHAFISLVCAILNIRKLLSENRKIYYCK